MLLVEIGPHIKLEVHTAWIRDAVYSGQVIQNIKKHILSKYARHPVEPLILIMMYKRISWDAVNRAAIMHI